MSDNIGVPSLNLLNTYAPYTMNSETLRYTELNTKLTSLDVLITILKNKQYQPGHEKKLFILKGLTGCGKSSFFIDALQREFDTNIICTEPTKLLCDNNVNAQVNLFGRILGETVGMKTGEKSIIPSSINKYVLFITVEILSMIINKPNLLKYYKIIVIDEVHELSTETLICLYNIKNSVYKYYDDNCCPLFILQSATVDVETIASYFDINVVNPLNFANIKGSETYPITTHFIEGNMTLCSAIVKNVMFAIDEIIRRHKDEEYEDILIMVNSGIVVKTYIDKLINSIISNKKVKKEDILLYYGTINDINKINDNKLQILIFELNSSNIKSNVFHTKRLLRQEFPNLIKIIFSSAVAESGVTIKNIGFCIDSGYSRQEMIIPLISKRELHLIPESFSSFIQKHGRVGRTSPGDFIGLYEKHVPNHLSSYRSPTLFSSEAFSSLFIDYLTSAKQIINPYMLNKLLYPFNIDVILESIRTLCLRNIIDTECKLIIDDHSIISSSAAEFKYSMPLKQYLIEYIKTFNFNSFNTAFIFVYVQKILAYENNYNLSRCINPYKLENMYLVSNGKYNSKINDHIKTLVKYFELYYKADISYLDSVFNTSEKEEYINFLSEVLECYLDEKFDTNIQDNGFDGVEKCVMSIFNIQRRYR